MSVKLTVPSLHGCTSMCICLPLFFFFCFHHFHLHAFSQNMLSKSCKTYPTKSAQKKADEKLLKKLSPFSSFGSYMLGNQSNVFCI